MSNEIQRLEAEIAQLTVAIDTLTNMPEDQQPLLNRRAVKQQALAQLAHPHVRLGRPHEITPAVAAGPLGAALAPRALARQSPPTPARGSDMPDDRRPSPG